MPPGLKGDFRPGGFVFDGIGKGNYQVCVEVRRPTW